MPRSGSAVGHQHQRRNASKLLGLVTLWDGSPNHECALPLWCQQAHRLARNIPPPWRTQLVVMAPRSSGECNASYIWNNDTADANAAYLARTPIKGSWAYLKSCVLLKWSVFALGHLDLVLYADIDVDLYPPTQVYRGVKLPYLFHPLFRSSMDAFLQSTALIVSDPDHSSPINTGIFLAKPTRWVHLAALSCMYSCRFTSETGFDEAGRPQQVFNRSRPLWQQLEVKTDAAPAPLSQPPVCSLSLSPDPDPIAHSIQAGTGSPRGSAIRKLQTTEMWKKNTWAFVAGNLEQGAPCRATPRRAAPRHATPRHATPY